MATVVSNLEIAYTVQAPAWHCPYCYRAWDTFDRAMRCHADKQLDLAQQLAMNAARDQQTLQQLQDLSSAYLAALQNSVTDRAQLNSRVAALEQLNTQVVNNTANITRLDSASQAVSASNMQLVTRLNSITSAVSGLTSALIELQSRALRGATGRSSMVLPISLLTQTVTIPIVLSSEMPNADWLPLVFLDSTSVALLGQVSVVYPVTNKTTTGCVVTVRVAGALSLATTLIVQVAALDISPGT